MYSCVLIFPVGPSDSVRAEESLILKGIDLEYENDGQCSVHALQLDSH